MAKLLDDPRYAQALAEVLSVEDQQHQAFRQRLAAEAAGRVATALAAMDGRWNDQAIREALADWDQRFVELSTEYIRETMSAAGRIESAKRLDEVREQVELADLPPALAAAVVELDRLGEFERFADLETP